jgi:hypothetical protein
MMIFCGSVRVEGLERLVNGVGVEESAKEEMIDEGRLIREHTLLWIKGHCVSGHGGSSGS